MWVTIGAGRRWFGEHGQLGRIERLAGVARGVQATVLSAVLVSMAACTAEASAATLVADRPKPSRQVAPQAQISVTPADGAADVAPDAPVSVEVRQGQLDLVRVTGSDGSIVPGTINSGGSRWAPATTLASNTAYTVTVEAHDARGFMSSLTTTFHTLKPAKRLRARIAPVDGATVGVGMPIVVKFTSAPADRPAAQRRLSVHTSVPVEGAWSWVSPTEVHYRPRDHWPVGTVVSFAALLNGLRAGEGVYGDRDYRASFRVGDVTVSTVDVQALTMTVTRNGEVLRVIPITSGKPGFLTRGGTKVIMEKIPHLVMDASTIGISRNSPEYYHLEVKWNMRVTWSGEFLHAAPWSVGSQGRSNVSHGCVGMSPANAQWLYNLSRQGDIVQVVGSSRSLERGNGWTDWNVPWEEWVKGSAL